ncbi:MAG: DUF1501 domain-containing protein [Planctomycetota bacterium]
MNPRRSFLAQSACGFGALAFSELIRPPVHANGPGTGTLSSSNGLHHLARAKRVIFLFMQGGVSQVDSFDRKPLLDEKDGQLISFDDAREFANTRQLGSQQRVMKSPWTFKKYGECGRWVSDLFPKIGEHVDKLTFIHSMHTDGVAHGPATIFLHTGTLNFIRPSIGSWTIYGLGSENENLPGFISIAPSIGNGGPRNYGAAFLPARYQGTPVGSANESNLRMDYIDGAQLAAAPDPSERWKHQNALNNLQLRQLQSAGRIEGGSNLREANFTGSDELESLIASYELAARMQTSAPNLFDFSGETEGMRQLYGLDDKKTETYGKRCLLARRLCEAGVRFIQVNYGDDSANPAWDQHSGLPKHADHAAAVDRPIAGLLTDLAQRGLLEDTLVWWGSEFGRQPYAEKNGTGRDHNPGGFTMWLAGGGMKPGFAHGSTDDFGQQAISDKVHMHDLHATILHALGIDHERLTYRFAGRDFRLTDVHGRVVQDLFS